MPEAALQEPQRHHLLPAESLLSRARARTVHFAKRFILGVLLVCWAAVLLAGCGNASLADSANSTSRLQDQSGRLAQVREVPPPPPELVSVVEKGQRVFGPADGSLMHKGRMYMDYFTAGSGDLSNVAVEARFYHPQACSTFPWDIGFVFRRDAARRYALWIDCEDGWAVSLMDEEMGLWIPIDRGPLQGLNVAEGGSNLLRLVAAEAEGYLFLNDRPAARLDLSDFVSKGKVDIAVNFSHSNQRPGKSTKYEGFAVSSLDVPPSLGQSGREVLSWGAPPGQRSVAPGRILFGSKPPGGAPAVFTVNPGGGELAKVTELGTGVGSASWSPDGRTMVWDRDGTGDRGIFAKGPDEAEPRRLTQSKGFKYAPRWSPDGRKIAFYATPASALDHNSDIWVMNADGTGETRLTDHPAQDISPAWSPDSKRIAFVSNRDGNAEIYVMDADGTNERRITNDPFTDTTPAWSPDGTKIAFASDRSGRYRVYTMNPDGKAVARLTEGGRGETNPVWSPDGKMVAFSGLVSAGSPAGLGYNLFVVGTDGSGLVRTTFERTVDVPFSWIK